MEAKNKDDPKGKVWSVTFWLAEAAKPSTCRLAGTSQSRAATSGGVLAHAEPAHACIQLTGVHELRGAALLPGMPQLLNSDSLQQPTLPMLFTDATLCPFPLLLPAHRYFCFELRKLSSLGAHCHCIWELQNCDSIQKFTEQKLHYPTNTHGAVLTGIV